MRKHALQNRKLAEDKLRCRRIRQNNGRTSALLKRLEEKNTYLAGSSVQYLSAGSITIVEPSLRHIEKNYFMNMALAKLSSESESQMSASDAQLHGCGVPLLAAEIIYGYLLRVPMEL
jgi:hypothetical protein